jgi:peptidoglycan-associated lipoprotein
MKIAKLAAVSLCAAALAFQGCASAEKKPAEGPSTASEKEKETAKLAAATETVESSSAAAAPDVRPVYFTFDSVELMPEGQQALKQTAEWLGSRPDARVTLEGHADERGTEEYNLSLGQRRAEVMRGYLERLGVRGGQIKTVSYGELKPAVAGNDDEAHDKNRRGEVKLDGIGRRG